MKKNSTARRYSSGGLKSTRASVVGETGSSQTSPMIFFRFEVIISFKVEKMISNLPVQGGSSENCEEHPKVASNVEEGEEDSRGGGAVVWF